MIAEKGDVVHRPTALSIVRWPARTRKRLALAALVCMSMVLSSCSRSMRIKGEVHAYGQPEVRGCVISSLTRDGKRAFQSMSIEATFDVKLAIGAGSIAVFRVDCELPKVVRDGSRCYG